MSASELHDYRLTAAVDRVRFETTLQNPSQFQHLKNRTASVWGKMFFSPVDNAGLVWQFWLQDPVGPTRFMIDVQAMRGPNEPIITENQVRVVGLEVAIDAYHPSNDREALAQAALYFLQHRAHPPKGLPRIPEPRYLDNPLLAAEWNATKAAHALLTAEASRLGTQPPPALPKRFGTRRAVESPSHALQALRRGLGIHQGAMPHGKIGKCKDDVALHVYVKTTDTAKNGESYAPLPPHQCRARMENRLQSDNADSSPLPFDSIATWRTFRFETLAESFALVVPKPPATPLAAVMAEQQLQFGRRSDAINKGRPDNRRKSACSTRRDSALNDRIRMALRALDSSVKLQKR